MLFENPFVYYAFHGFHLQTFNADLFFVTIISFYSSVSPFEMCTYIFIGKLQLLILCHPFNQVFNFSICELIKAAKTMDLALNFFIYC